MFMPLVLFQSIYYVSSMSKLITTKRDLLFLLSRFVLMVFAKSAPRIPTVRKGMNVSWENAFSKVGNIYSLSF